MTCQPKGGGPVRVTVPSSAAGWLALVFVLAVSVQIFAQQVPGPGPDDEGDVLEYVIGPEDVLEIAVWNNTAISFDRARHAVPGPVGEMARGAR